MIDLLDTLHRCAVDLRRVGMMQSAGDYDYLVAWLRSPEFNNGEHLKPHPAGENTIDEYPNNCPIPFTPNRQMVSYCTDNDRAEQLIQSARNIITELLNVYTDDIEQTAINVYLDYSDKIIALLGGEVPVPTPPDPPVEEFGEIIKAYLTAEGAANTNTMWISTTDRPLYDDTGSPLLFESGYKYDVLGAGTNSINGDAYLNTVSPGEQMSVSASYNFRVSSNIVFIFKVTSEESFTIYPLSAGYSIQGYVTIAAGSLGFLYGMGSGTPTGYSSLSGKVLRDIISGTGERLGTDGFVIEKNDSNYATLRNNRAESVTVSRVIFSD